MNKIEFGDCRETMRRWAADGVKVQTCVTSPPYFGLRDYGHDGQIGLEQTPDEYIKAMVEVFRCVWDVLADDGVVFLNIGDSYFSGVARARQNGIDGKAELSSQDHGRISENLCDVRKGSLWSRILCSDGRLALELAHESLLQIRVCMEELSDRLPNGGCFHQQLSLQSFVSIADRVKKAIRAVEQFHVFLGSTNLESLQQPLGALMPMDLLLASLSALRSFSRCVQRCVDRFGGIGVQLDCMHDIEELFLELEQSSRCTDGYCLLVSHWFNRVDIEPDCTRLLKPKDLIGIPWMLAFALRADGWYLRQDIIWHKPNPMPESVRDRCTKAHEYIFLLSKSERYFFDSEAMKEPSAQPERAGKLERSFSTGKPDAVLRQDVGRAVMRTDTRNRRSVWTVATRPYKGAHFATFPPALIEPCILAGSRPGDIVLDPFMGSGTTAAVALQHGRQYMGCELNPEYGPLQQERIAKATPAPDLFSEVAA